MRTNLSKADMGLHYRICFRIMKIRRQGDKKSPKHPKKLQSDRSDSVC